MSRARSSSVRSSACCRAASPRDATDGQSMFPTVAIHTPRISNTGGAGDSPVDVLGAGALGAVVARGAHAVSRMPNDNLASLERFTAAFRVGPQISQISTDGFAREQ